MKELRKFVPVLKLDEATHTVYGCVSSEAIDSEGEIADYAGTKAAFQKWSADQLAKTTAAGQEPSLGNIRVMHQVEVGGKVTALDFDDAAKRIMLRTQPVSDEVWEMLKGGYLTGYSLGGKYASREPEMLNGREVFRYVPVLAETSYVDMPANPDAVFTLVRADGSMELRKFAAKAKRTKRVAGEDLEASAFAYVGDPEKTETWKLPIKFSTEAKTKSHIRNAIARFDQTQGIPADEKPKVWRKIVAAAKEHGIEVGEEKEKAARAGAKLAAIVKAAPAAKGMHNVGCLADAVQQLAYMAMDATMEAIYEADGSEVPGELQAAVEELTQVLVAMTDEETRELKEQMAGIKAGKGATTMTTEQIAKAAKTLRAHMERIRRAHERLRDHHEKAAELHSKMADTIEAAHKAAADAEAEREPEEPKGDEGEKAAAAGAAAAGMTAEQVQAIVQKAIEDDRAKRPQPTGVRPTLMLRREGDAAKAEETDPLKENGLAG